MIFNYINEINIEKEEKRLKQYIDELDSAYYALNTSIVRKLGIESSEARKLMRLLEENEVNEFCKELSVLIYRLIKQLFSSKGINLEITIDEADKNLYSIRRLELNEIVIILDKTDNIKIFNNNLRKMLSRQVNSYELKDYFENVKQCIINFCRMENEINSLIDRKFKILNSELLRNAILNIVQNTLKSPKYSKDLNNLPSKISEVIQRITELDEKLSSINELIEISSTKDKVQTLLLKRHLEALAELSSQFYDFKKITEGNIYNYNLVIEEYENLIKRHIKEASEYIRKLQEIHEHICDNARKLCLKILGRESTILQITPPLKHDNIVKIDHILADALRHLEVDESHRRVLEYLYSQIGLGLEQGRTIRLCNELLHNLAKEVKIAENEVLDAILGLADLGLIEVEIRVS